MQMFFRDDQLKRHDTDKLKCFLRPKFGGYTVTFRYVLEGSSYGPRDRAPAAIENLPLSLLKAAAQP